ncbi:MAG TPA: Gfo/Idh/MocA family oxidoreductase [Polyangiaceae bacterium]|jgi:predicted dehydrogenase
MVAGCGNVSRWSYLPHLTRAPYVKIVALCDVAEPAVKEAAAAFGVRQWFTSADEMIRRTEADLFVNLTSMPFHGPLNLKALGAGLHVWSEKPIATTMPMAKRLLTEARRARRYCLSAPCTPLSPQFQAAARLIRTGELGTVSQLRGRYGHGGQQMWAGWFFRKGGGALFDLGVYNVTTLTGWMGPVRRVMAMAGTAIPLRTLSGGKSVRAEVEDNNALLLDFGQSRFGIVQSGFTFTKVDRAGGHHTDSDPGNPSIEIIGTKGSVRMLGYDWAPGGLEVGLVKEPGWRLMGQSPKDYVWQCGATYLARCLATRKKPILTQLHATHVLDVMLAAHRSARSGRAVSVHSVFPFPINPP